MKLKIWIAVSLIIVLVGCIKGIATEDDKIGGALHDRNFGASASELLSNGKYTSLKVEIQYMAGYEPDSAALKYFKDFLYARLNKRGGIEVETKEIAPVTTTALTRPDVLSIERANRSAFTNGRQIAVYILYTNGDFVDSRILGEAYRNTSIVMYGNSIRDNSGRLGKPSRTNLEATLLMHEMGHLLGLVNKGTPMKKGHKDASHTSHCKNRKCLMYYGIEIEDKYSLLIRKEIPKLDADCLADLRENGGR